MSKIEMSDVFKIGFKEVYHLIDETQNYGIITLKYNNEITRMCYGMNITTRKYLYWFDLTPDMFIAKNYSEIKKRVRYMLNNYKIIS